VRVQVYPTAPGWVWAADRPDQLWITDRKMLGMVKGAEQPAAVPVDAQEQTYGRSDPALQAGMSGTTGGPQGQAAERRGEVTMTTNEEANPLGTAATTKEEVATSETGTTIVSGREVRMVPRTRVAPNGGEEIRTRIETRVKMTGGEGGIEIGIEIGRGMGTGMMLERGIDVRRDVETTIDGKMPITGASAFNGTFRIMPYPDVASYYSMMAHTLGPRC
jgi:hypothetical protein